MNWISCASNTSLISLHPGVAAFLQPQLELSGPPKPAHLCLQAAYPDFFSGILSMDQSTSFPDYLYLSTGNHVDSGILKAHQHSHAFSLACIRYWIGMLTEFQSTWQCGPLVPSVGTTTSVLDGQSSHRTLCLTGTDGNIPRSIEQPTTLYPWCNNCVQHGSKFCWRRRSLVLGHSVPEKAQPRSLYHKHLCWGWMGCHLEGKLWFLTRVAWL